MPSAMQGEARLRGRERNGYSKTIISVFAPRAPRLGGEQYIHRSDAEGAERRSAAFTRTVGRGCTCRRTRAPRAIRSSPDYSRQNSSTSASIRRIRADPCSILPSTPPCSAKPAQLRQYSGRSATHSDTPDAGSQFSVPGSRFLVLSSQFSVLSSQFPGRRRHRLCGTISALCCAFIHKLDGGVQSVRSSHSWH
jgi:hypothetical protein